MPLVGITGTEAKPLTVTKATQRGTFKWRDDVVAWTKHVADGASIENSDIVFAGYGVEAPEFNWDDFKGVDVKGKTIIVLVNDPAFPTRRIRRSSIRRRSAATAMTYYGRWTYKFEEGARKGAAGVLIVHETGPAGYPFSGRAGQSSARSSTSSRRTRTWAARASKAGSRSTPRRRLLQDGRAGLRRAEEAGDDARVQAGAARAQGVDGASRTRCGRSTRSNVVAKLEGSDPR